MSNPWFRMYSEFAHDPKVQMMNEAMQRRYMMLMCMRCSNALVTLHETEVAFHLRISNEEMAETKALFIAKGFIDKDFNLLNWEKRQFSSDTSNARVAKHRLLQKEKQIDGGNATVTLPERNGNALDTDTDTDTDTEKTGRKRTAAKRRQQIPDAFYPDETGLDKAREKGLSVAVQLTKFVDYHVGKGSVMSDWQAAWRTWIGNARPETPNGKPAETAYQRSQREKYEQIAPAVAARAPNNPNTFFNVATLEISNA